MKKIFLIAIVMLLSVVTFAQATKKADVLKDGVFYTVFESGIGEKINMQFDVVDTNKIIQTEVYQKWKADTAHSSNVFTLTYFLSLKTMSADFFAKYSMKNKTSYSPIPNTTGSIYVTSKNELSITFYCQGQNGYGNTIRAQAFYVLSWDEQNNKEKKFNFISTN